MLLNSTTYNPVITGSSVHNVRIERLWRDTFRCVLSVFHQLFHHLETCGKLDHLSEIDLFCLHFVYLPRISNALDMFQSGWNNHAITTEQCRTPLQLFTAGTLAHGPWPQPTNHNISNDQVEISGGVVVQEVNCPLSPEKTAELQSLVNPLQPSLNYGIDLFDEVKRFVLNNL